MKTRNAKNNFPPVIVIVAVLAFILAGCGGKGLDSVTAPASGESSATPFTSESPEEMTAFAAAAIGVDAANITTFSGGASIASAGATFLDMSTCANCHAANYQSFLLTNHNLAWEKKAVQNRPEYGKPYFEAMVSYNKKYCVQCHTVTSPFLDVDGDHNYEPGTCDTTDTDLCEAAPFGLTPSTTSGTFGGVLGTATFTVYTEVPDEYKGIQCENCHGPASLHNGDKNLIVDEKQARRATTCSYCHSQYKEWKKSHHAIAISTDESVNPASHAVEYAQGANGSCAGCHTGEGFIEAMDAVGVEPKDFNATGGYTGAGKGTAGYYGNTGITCAVCHDPHSKSKGEHQLRAPKHELCGKCHNSRYRKYVSSGTTKYDKTPGQGRGPHQPQKEIWEGGTGGNGGVQISTASSAISSWGFSTGTTTLKWAFVSGEKFMGETNCIDCHMYQESHVYGHTFNPRTEACQSCHTSMNASNVIGNIQARFVTRYDNLRTRLDSYLAANASVSSSYCPEDAGNRCCNSMSAGEAREKCAVAEYNLRLLDADHSEGVHNETYANTLFDISEAILKEFGY
ncbi:MAG: multiheme c-type cytochrome [bacterium]